ncbi:MAG: HAD hydrolase-like protein [Actinomycetota bacterium]|nr:HAD hydrolase-like protein [Actinomycetota bacterium]
MVRALLFDFDGVVVDTEVGTYESWRHIYREYGVDLALADWLPVVGSGTSTAADAVFDAFAHLETLAGLTLDRERVVERRRRRKVELCNRAELLPGLASYLVDAQRLGLKTAIVTRADDAWVEHHLTRVALAHVWDAIVCSNGRHSTAKSVLYLEALQQLDVKSRDAIAFEDSPHGVRAASEAGIFCIAVPNDVTRKLPFHDADLVLGSLAEHPLARLLACLERDEERLRFAR